MHKIVYKENELEFKSEGAKITVVCLICRIELKLFILSPFYTKTTCRIVTSISYDISLITLTHFYPRYLSIYLYSEIKQNPYTKIFLS